MANAEEFSKQFAVDTLRRNGGRVVVPADPVADALNVRKQSIASAILDETKSDLDLQKLEKDVKRTELEIQRNKLEEERNPTKAGAPDEFMGYLVAQIEKANAQLAEAQERALTAQQELLRQQLGSLGAEIERLKVARAEAGNTESVDPADEMLARIESARKLLAVASPPPETILGYDPQLERFKGTIAYETRKMELEHEHQRYQLEQELQIKREIAQLDARAAASAIEQQNRFLEKSVPQILELGQRLLDAFTKGQAAAAPAVAAATAPLAPTLPAGVVTFDCQGCGLPIYTRADAHEARCQACGINHLNDEVPAPAPMNEPARAATKAPATPDTNPNSGAAIRARQMQGMTGQPSSQEMPGALSELESALA